MRTAKVLLTVELSVIIHDDVTEQYDLDEKLESFVNELDYEFNNDYIDDEDVRIDLTRSEILDYEIQYNK